jgi:hypothetical protein
MPQMLSETLTKLVQGIGRAIRCETDDTTVWFADPRVPIPACVTEETGLLPAKTSYNMLLSAIPKRFLEAFERSVGAATIGVPYQPPVVKDAKRKVTKGKSRK